jgi:tRNA1(Val) A37 N6-methylase TrmN6
MAMLIPGLGPHAGFPNELQIQIEIPAHDVHKVATTMLEQWFVIVTANEPYFSNCAIIKTFDRLKNLLGFCERTIEVRIWERAVEI